MLIQRGCYIDHPDQVAPSPLHLAACCDQMDIVAMLHQHGASLIRGITITEHNYAVVSSRYFLGIFHDDSEERSYFIKGWVEVKELASLLESAAGAAVHATDVESDGTIVYMVPIYRLRQSGSRLLVNLLNFFPSLFDNTSTLTTVVLMIALLFRGLCLTSGV